MRVKRRVRLGDGDSGSLATATKRGGYGSDGLEEVVGGCG